MRSRTTLLTLVATPPGNTFPERSKQLKANHFGGIESDRDTAIAQLHPLTLLSKVVTATVLNMSVERRSLVLRGVLDLCLLALLRERPVYGYELTERLAEQDLLVAGGSTYPLLARLEKAGLVVSEIRPSSSGPPRKYYALSDDGVAVLANGTTEWLAVSSSVTSLLQSESSSDNRTESA